MANDPILTTDLAGLTLASPVLLAAGTAGVLDEMACVVDLSRVGAIVTKSITREPRAGNEPWRVAPLGVGMLNAVGLANPGIERFIADIVPRATALPTVVIGSIAGFSIEDYVIVARAMEGVEAIPAVELNVSCPNAHSPPGQPSIEFAADPGALRELVGAVRAELVTTRLIVKLAPIAVGQPNMVDIARAAIAGAGTPSGPNEKPGADALTISNTIPAMAIDVQSRRPELGNTTGGLSGPALHPIALKLVFDVYRGATRDAGIPIIGLGGVLGWKDAAAFILAGATAVGIGTGLFADPRTPIKVAKGLARWVWSQSASSISELIGSIRTE